MSDPRLEALVESISRGEDPPGEDLVRALRGAHGVVRNMAVLQKVDRFHRELHDGIERTVMRPASEQALRRWGHLELREPLGHGGFGEVHRAYDPTLQREVALKLFREDLRGDADALLREARQLAKIRHENVVTVYGVEQHDGRAGYWMELVRGKDLESQLRDDGPFGADEARQVGLVLCRALAALHALGLVHRDVKTANVLRERGGRLVLMDFGTATALDEVGKGALSGTPAYMAPETLLGEASTVAADLYAVGVLLFHLCTAKYPYEARTLGELQDRQRAGERRRLRDLRPDLPTAFCEIVERALAYEPSERFASAGELELALMGATAPTRTALPRWSFAMAAVLVVAVALTLWRPWSAGGGPMLVDARMYTLQDEAIAAVGDQSSLSVGAPLWMELRASRSAHVYVLNRDQHGAVHLLFPLPDYDTQNPLPADALVELPGRRDGTRRGWQVSSRGEQEEFLIVASPKPLLGFEESLALLPVAGEDDGTALALGEAQAEELVRGVGSTMALPEIASMEGGLADIFALAEGLGAGDGRDRDLWIRKIVVANR